MKIKAAGRGWLLAVEVTRCGCVLDILKREPTGVSNRFDIEYKRKSQDKSNFFGLTFLRKALCGMGLEGKNSC